MKEILRVVLALVLCLIVVLSSSVRPAWAAGVITYSADRTTIGAGERFTLFVNVDSTPGLFGAQLSLNYDNTRLEVIEVRTGSGFPVGSTYAYSTFTDGGTANETIQFYAVITNPALTVSAGSLVEVVFEAKATASQVTTQISNGSVLPLMLADKDGQEIPSTPPSPITITITPTAEVTGTVTLQAPTNSRVITVNIANASYQANASILSGQQFTLSIPPASDYTLTASAACHLGARKTNVTSPSSGHNTTLTAGDINADSTINILDLAMIGIKFGLSGVTGCENLNGDPAGLVNILDLSLAAGNFGKSGPTPW